MSSSFVAPQLPFLLINQGQRRPQLRINIRHSSRCCQYSSIHCSSRDYDFSLLGPRRIRLKNMRWSNPPKNHPPFNGVFSAANQSISNTFGVSSTAANEWFRKESRQAFQTHKNGTRSFSQTRRKSRRRRSPYAVLGLSGTTDVTHDEIKSAFRKLVKIYHPDLNPGNRHLEECESLMSELVEAYERLLKNNEDEDDFLENIRVGASNKVALACELYSVDELTRDNFHEVYPLRMEYAKDEIEATETQKETDLCPSNKPTEKKLDNSSSLPQSTSSLFAISVGAHPRDSVLDLKERLESEFGSDWGLENCIGWELLTFNTKSMRNSKNKNTNHRGNNSRDDEDSSTIAVHNEVFSYHLFLEDYGIRHGDTIYAVVRKNED